MYFGSVRFFKHLIVTIILLLIIIPVTISFALSEQLKNKDLEIIEMGLKKDAVLSLLDIKNGSADISDMTAEDFYSLLNIAGVSDKALAEILFKHNSELLNEIINQHVPAVTEPISTGQVSDSADETVTEAPFTEEFETETAIAAMTNGTSDGTFTTKNEDEDKIETEKTPSYQELYPDLYVNSVYSGEYNDDENYIYLTFDDGPSDITPNILYYLDKHEVKATFFVIPDNTENCKKLLNTMLDNGHAIGIHTATHDYDKIYNSVESYLEDFYTAFKLVEEQTGHRPFLFRFPGGSKNDYNPKIYDELVSEMNRRGFVYFDWNVDSRDSLGANWTQMYNTVLKETAQVKRAVILFHDGYGRKNTVYVIEDILKELLGDPKCYTFSVINEKTRPLIF